MEEPQENMGPDLDRIGIFKEMSYHQGSVPAQISFNDSAKKGKQMMTSCTKTIAGNQDGYFHETFPRVFEGEAYTDRIRLNRLNRLEKAKQNLTKFFKYSSPTKKPSGKGSNFGTFTEYSKPLEHFSSHAGEHIKVEPQKKNVCVNPPQKGTGYGYPNLTIGKYPPYFLEKEYEELKNTPSEPKKPQPRPFAPFRTGIFQQDYFDPNPFRTEEKTLPSKTSEILATEEDKEDKERAKKPFIPSNPAKKDGGMKAGCLSPFPTHTSEPFPRIELVPRGVKTYINAENQMFRPVPGVRPYPVKSIINKNVKMRVNAMNFAAVKGVVYCNEKWKK